MNRNEAYYIAQLAESGVPEGAHDGLLNYLLHHIPTGSFLEAVLSNDLAEACGRADYLNRPRLYAYVNFLYNAAPSAAWGSPAKYQDWLSRRAVVEPQEAKS